MIKGIIFDLDGVLVSTDEMHYLAWKRLADELQITGFTREDNRRQRGVSRMASLEIVLEKADRVYTEEEKAELAERKNNYYLELLEHMDESAVLKNVKEVLSGLKERGLLLAVGSASKNAPDYCHIWIRSAADWIRQSPSRIRRYFLSQHVNWNFLPDNAWWWKIQQRELRQLQPAA
jgi:beta-phosphoglucomutase-like phosphatase (HAD superfamily)